MRGQLETKRDPMRKVEQMFESPFWRLFNAQLHDQGLSFATYGSRMIIHPSLDCSPIHRSYQDLQDIVSDRQIAFNTEFEKVQVLLSQYANASREARLAILEDLEFYLHQYDNARDFVAVGGLEAVARPAMESQEEEFRVRGRCTKSSKEL